MSILLESLKASTLCGSGEPEQFIVAMKSLYICSELIPEATRFVFFTSITNDTTAPFYYYFFNNAISDTTLDGRQCAGSPSIIATLLFGQAFVKQPYKLVTKELPDQVYDQVVDAIRNAMDIYKDCYSDEKVTVDPDDACELLKGHGNFRKLVHETSHCMTGEILQQYLMQLQKDHILLLCLEEPYRVISIVHSASGQELVAFCSQRRSLKEKIFYGGALLLWTTKKYNILPVSMLSLSLFSDNFIDKECKIDVVQIL